MHHPGLKLKIPPLLFCMSWCPDFEFRGIYIAFASLWFRGGRGMGGTEEGSARSPLASRVEEVSLGHLRTDERLCAAGLSWRRHQRHVESSGNHLVCADGGAHLAPKHRQHRWMSEELPVCLSCSRPPDAAAAAAAALMLGCRDDRTRVLPSPRGRSLLPDCQPDSRTNQATAAHQHVDCAPAEPGGDQRGQRRRLGGVGGIAAVFSSEREVHSRTGLRRRCRRSRVGLTRWNGKDLLW